MQVWEVLQRTKSGDGWEPVGGVKASDLEMAFVLARETHFRHGEATEYALRALGEDEVHVATNTQNMGGVIDRAYRKSEGYAGVGAKLKRVHKLMQERGLVIDRPRPPQHRARDGEPAHG